MSDGPVDDKVAVKVVTFLGIGMLLGLAGVILLVHESIQSTNQVDPSTVALVSGVSTLVGMGFGALGAILGRPSSSPQSVTVDQPANQPIPTTDATTGNPPSTVEIHPDAPATSDL